MKPSKPIKNRSDNNRRMLSASLLMVGIGIVLPGCDILGPAGLGLPTISDGELNGVNGWDVRASINVEPNQGEYGTPVAMAVDFSRGAADVSTIEFEERVGVDCGLNQTWRNQFTQTTSTRWILPSGRLILIGNSGTLRFVARNATGTRIAIGDIKVNGGCTNSSRFVGNDLDPSDFGLLETVAVP